MRIIIKSAPVIEVTRHSWTALPMHHVLPPRNVDCAKLADVTDAVRKYCLEIKESGRVAVVSVIKDHRDPSRTIAGFKRLTEGTLTVNFPAITGDETVKCEHPALLDAA
jgi:hypothetical protein